MPLISKNKHKCDEILVDIRDGREYETIKIGDQCWMKENLNIGTMVKNRLGEMHSDASENGIIEKYCYDNDETNCEKRGGLYTWDEAMQYDTISGSQGICPAGWHIPTVKEVETLADYLSAEGNTNEIKMQDVFESGYCDFRYTYGKFYIGKGFNVFWTSDDVDPTAAYAIISYKKGKAPKTGKLYKVKGFAVRCIKD